MSRTMMAGLLPLLALAPTACTDPNRHAQAISVLVDVSGTYTDQKAEVMTLVKRGILPDLQPGDRLTVIVIDDRSYEKENVVASLHLDVRPSQANAQKLAFAGELDAFAARQEKAPFTDIRGAMMLSADYLRETGAGRQVMIVFSDLEEDLPKGAVRDLGPTEFEGMRVVAMNVKRLAADNANPALYRERLSTWEERVIASGAAEWRVVLDPQRLVEYLAAR